MKWCLLLFFPIFGVLLHFLCMYLVGVHNMAAFNKPCAFMPHLAVSRTTVLLFFKIMMEPLSIAAMI